MKPGRIDVVVILASTKFTGHQLYEQRLARALGAGNPVFYVEPAVPVLGLGRAREPRPAPPPAGVTVVTPSMLPFGRRPAFAVLTAVLVAATVLITLVRHGIRPGRRVGVIVSAAHPVTVRLLRSMRLVALVKDDYVAGAGLIGVPAARLARRRQAVLGLVDRVAVVSPVLRRSLLEVGVRAAVIPPGCDPGGLPARTGSMVLAGVRRPRAVFIGMISDRIDFGVMERIVADGVEIVVVGRQQTTFSQHARWQSLLDTGRVHAVGQLDRAGVVDVVAACDIGLVPYVLDPFNLASFPLKTLEYLAVGRPVVATALPALEWLAAPHVHVSAEPATDVVTVRAALADAAGPDTAAECVAFAARHDWSLRADAFRRELADVRR